MERIQFIHRVNNKDILVRVKENRILLIAIQKRNRNPMGHIMRGKGILIYVIEGNEKQKRR